MFIFPQRCAWAIGLAVLLSACTSFSPDGGFDEVRQTTQDRTGLEARWSRSDSEREQSRQRVDELLSRPLSVDDAVQVALLNNLGLQAAYQEMGISEADRVQVGRLPNPSISFGRLKQGDALELDRGLHFDLSRWLLAPWVSGVESRRFEQARLQATIDTLHLVASTRQAWFTAVAADESVRYGQQVLSAAEAGQALAASMVKVGNWNQLDLAREQGFRGEASLGLMQARQRQTVAREQLTRLMGLSGQQTTFKLPERLPDLPQAPAELPGIEQQAVDERLDLKAMKARTDGLVQSLGLSKVTRMINVLEVGGVRNSFNDAPRQTGYDITLEIPLFDWGGARVARAEAVYMQSVHQLAQAAVEVRSEVRQAYQGYRSSHEIARHFRDEILPLRKRISAENQLRYNGMLISVFDLLADARAQVSAAQGNIDALRDFWLAQSELQMALVGKAPMMPGSKP